MGRVLALILGLVGLCAAVAARAEPVALTFDDVPAMALDESAPYAKVTTRRLLRGLRRRHMPAIGFVIGGQLEGARAKPGRKVLLQWMDAGFELGNHSYSHESLNKTPVEDYIADVARNDALLRPLMARRGQAPHWYRHPYLDTGATLDSKHAFETWLAAHGYRVAPVTMENSDWMFSPVYDDALRRHDKVRAEQVKRIYIDYTARVVAWYRQAGLQLLDRRPAYVFLLHACRLNADALGDLAKILHDNDLHPVRLETAMKDPAYALSDDWADPEGDEWLSRWSHTLGRELPWDTFPDPPSDIAAESERLDPST
ncbi:MAG TPA: polysaccharide deacetylase family protein [Phenylobacterium sp.]|nr:polysaccharide deacetylase family protein [Phenylobacterium sp.]